MKKRIGQVFSLALAVVLVIAMAIPAHADVSDAAGYVVGEFWDMMTGKEYDMYFDYWKNFAGYLAGEECPSSPDKYHHGNVPVGGIGVFGSGGTDDNGKFVWHTCDYCGEQFKVYASDLQQSYDAQVAELPAQGVTSAGKLLWQPVFSDVYRLSCSHSYGSTDIFSDVTSDPSSPGFSCSFDSRSTYRFFEIYFHVPFSGSYRELESTVLEYSFTSSGGQVKSGMLQDDPRSTVRHLDSLSSLNTTSASFSDVCSKDCPISFNVMFPVYELILDSAIDINSGDTYNINSRPTSITGDYGIIGDNGQIIKVEGNKIVNETNNTYYNPATGETTTITDWSYNYEDRSYTVTTESGDTVTITYGDENVTIQEGDTIYNVYYLVNGSGSEGPGPDVPPACNHQWTETGTTPATCIVPGSRSLTCSLCNETKTETIPAPGHKWTVKQEVKNEYDENGNQTQEGYTIWECSVCGEQQKTTDGGAPPGGGGSGSGSSGGVFSGIFGLLVDFLGFFWNTFRDFVGEGVKGFLTALMDGTSSIFGLLNPFNWGG